MIMSVVEMQFRPDRVPLVSAGAMDLHEHDMTATFAADVGLAETQGKLAEMGQWLAVDGDPAAAIGRLVEINSTGPLRLGFGAWRDLLLGCQFENGRGELITVGGRTVKNVAGYDVTKLMVGQGGELGRIMTVTMRTYRRPAGVLVARFGEGPHMLSQLLLSAQRPHYALLTAHGLACGYLGDSRTLEHYQSVLPGIGAVSVEARTLEQDMQDRAAAWIWGRAETFRAAVPPTRVREFVERASLVDNWAADAAFGIVVGAAREADRARLAAAAAHVGGSVYFIDDQGRLKWDVPPGLAGIVGNIKAAFGK